MRVLEKIIQRIEGAERVLVTSHIRPDGDSIGSQIAASFILKSVGKEVTILNDDRVPIQYRFLKGAEFIKDVDSFNEERFDLALILDCNNWERVGRVQKYILMCPFSINVDHHPGEGIGTINYIDVKACCVGEQIYRLAKVWGLNITEEVALPLYVALFTDTGGFTQKNTTSAAHTLAAALLEAGVHPERVTSQLLRIENVGALKVFGLALINAKLAENGVIYSYITHDTMETAGCSDFPSDLLLHYLRSVNEVKVVALFREVEDGVRVNLRSTYIDVASVARKFGGGGHEGAAGCLLKEKMDVVKCKILEEINRRMDEACIR
jgi:phosphoesterase RecJ-like protein